MPPIMYESKKKKSQIGFQCMPPIGGINMMLSICHHQQDIQYAKHMTICLFPIEINIRSLEKGVLTSNTWVLLACYMMAMQRKTQVGIILDDQGTTIKKRKGEKEDHKVHGIQITNIPRESKNLIT